MHKTTGEVWDPLRLVILVQKSLFCMHKTNGEGWNPYGPDTLALSTLLYVLKNYRYGLGPIQTYKSGPKDAVLKAQNYTWMLEPI